MSRSTKNSVLGDQLVLVCLGLPVLAPKAHVLAALRLTGMVHCPVSVPPAHLVKLRSNTLIIELTLLKYASTNPCVLIVFNKPSDS